jgi:hypothetical protein
MERMNLPNYALFCHMKDEHNLTLTEPQMEEIKNAIKEDEKIKQIEAVNHPDHYNSQPIECIKIAELYNFNVGNAIKYLWRCEYKGNKKQDLQKAAFYIQREIDRDIEVEYWVDFKGTGLSMYFDELNLEFSNNIYSALYLIYGGYNKKKLENCLFCINKEIEILKQLDKACMKINTKS